MYDSNPLAVYDSVQDSDSAQGTSTAPTAGTAIATIASGSLPAGRYRIRAETMYTVTTPAAVEDINIEIRKGATAIKRVVCGRALNVLGRAWVIATLDGTQAVSINAVQNATASVVYVGSVTAERLGAAAIQA